MESLREQADQVFVYAGEGGDERKFARVEDVRGFVLICDDDLIYAPGYAAMMIEAVERYERRAVVTLQGKRLHRDLTSYYNDRGGFTKHSLQDPQAEDVRVHVGGTGVMAFHTDAFQGWPFPREAFKSSNMADLWASLWCAEQGVEIICVAHEGTEARLSPHVDHLNDSIWSRARKDDAEQTRLANEILSIYRQTAEEPCNGLS